MVLHVVRSRRVVRAARRKKKKSPQNLKNKTPGTIPYFAHSAVSAGSSVRSVPRICVLEREYYSNVCWRRKSSAPS